MADSILDLTKKRVVLLDGGMGTELIRLGLPQGECPELWNVEKPEIIQEVHGSYFEAGSDAVLTNSFGGSAIKLSFYGLERRCYELNFEAARIAKDVKPEDRFVGGSMGPTGKFLQPFGEYTEEEFEKAYAEQAKGLMEGGVDFLLIETQYDIKEALCALRVAKRVTSLPVFVTMTFKLTPRGFFTIMGNSVAQCIQELEVGGVSALGTNCTLNSAEMVDLVRIMRKITSLPLIAQANAGQPEVTSDGRVNYSQDVEDYVRHIPQMISNGVDIIGGCCGTNPEYIRRMAELVRSNTNTTIS
ncbi:MAG: homocysteine S-methyltransferase family protein [Candidatus Aminicenantales bacterium]